MRKSDRGLEINDDELQQFHRNRAPVSGWVGVIAEELEYKLYFKTNGDISPSTHWLYNRNANGKRGDKPIPSPDGWVLHVLFLNGVSVLEYYSRSQSLTEVETTGILAFNAGSSNWERGKPPGDDDSVIQPQVLPVNHYRKDLNIYAFISGNSILLYDPRLDERVHQEMVFKAQVDGPASLDGF